MSDRTRLGEIRPSQLLWTYGPGALIDLPSLSVVTAGIDHWPEEACLPIEEPRLLAAVRERLGEQVGGLRMPPVRKEEQSFGKNADDYIGVPVSPFPRWLRCVKCGLLSDYETGIFKIKTSKRAELTRFVHPDCKGSKGDKTAKEADAVPARFLLACREGHLDDFPWHFFVHGGQSDCKEKLRFYEQGASLQTENLWVKCDCGASRSLAQAFGEVGKSNLPACRGRNAHLGNFASDCKEQARAVLLGATNSWFPVTISALAIPLESDPICQAVADNWKYLESAQSIESLEAKLEVLSEAGIAPGLARFTSKALWPELLKRRGGNSAQAVTETDIKGPEWDVLTRSDPLKDFPHFMSSKAAAPAGFEHQIESVLLLERLREVNALVGFTRVEAPEEGADESEQPAMASLCHGLPDWVPASQVHGEGIFLKISEDAINAWEDLPQVRDIDRLIYQGHRGWRNSRKLNPDKGYPGVRYVLLHTLAHLLIRELALECGYNAASIRERIYADDEGDKPQAGLLIYTAAADSDGTLGGLVELGRPENLGRLLTQALERAQICSSDPLCAEHNPENDRSLHAAACHACALVAETSCERGNRYLDRALVVPTLERSGAAFFK
ncbi:MAG: DUF1998 domain-containing protein [Proteobacteria bacterium]|nr:DUF1998 domain-containing protein [Pseudomonadota bacterium]